MKKLPKEEMKTWKWYVNVMSDSLLRKYMMNINKEYDKMQSVRESKKKVILLAVTLDSFEIWQMKKYVRKEWKLRRGSKNEYLKNFKTPWHGKTS